MVSGPPVRDGERLAGRSLLAALPAAAAPALVGLVALGLARSVLLPGQGFWDTGEFQVVAPVLGTAHPTGYPSYVILGWLASLAFGPTGEPAFRVNLLSAALVAVAAGLLVVLVRGLTGRTSVAIAAGLLFALTPIPWQMSAFADPHTFHVALVAGLAVVLAAWERRRRAGDPGADRWLVAAAALYGVMLGNHSLTILLAPGVALSVRAVEPGIVRRWRFVGRCAAALLGTAALLYLELPIRAAMGAPLVYGRPDTWDGFWYVVLAQQFRGDLVDPFGDLGRKLADLAGLAAAQLGVLAPLVPAAFVVVAARRPRFALLSATWLIVTCWFAAAYVNAAIDRYYLGPILVAVAWLGIAAGIVADGVARAAPAVAGWLGLGAPAVVGGPAAAARARRVGGVLAVALAVALVAPAAVAAPATRGRIDRSTDTGAAAWSAWALRSTAPGAVIVSWWSFSTPLWYRTIVLGERPDVRIVDDRTRLDESLGSVDDVIRANLAERPVYLIRLPGDIAALAATWVLAEVPDPLGLQSIFRVVGPRPAAGRRRPGPRAASAIVPARIATMSP